jgi:FAD/FMN-containing dehydrogenase
MPEPLIEIKPKSWTNWHDTHGVGGAVDKFCTPRNAWVDGTPLDPSKRFEPGLAALQKLVRLAEAANKRVRALGSGWSLSSIAFVDEFLVNTTRLTEWSIGLSAVSVAPAFQAKANRIVFAQCGTQITSLNAGLEHAGFALATAGASNGQTIAGAMSTGTHGSAHSVGAIHDRVRALHVIGEGGKSWILQPKSNPLLTQDFANWLGAEICTLGDGDDLFYAALVGFGSFGLIHAVFLEVEPLYLLGLYIKQFDYTEITQAALTHDISQLPLAPGPRDPYHIEFVINPYRRGPGQQGVFVRVLYKQPYQAGAPLPVLPIEGGKPLRAHDLVSTIAVGSEIAPVLIGPLLQSQIKDGAPPTGDRVITGTPGQHFGDSTPTGGGTSVEIGVPLARLGDALEAIFAATDKQPFGAPVALRYVKASEALLAFTHFEPLTVAIEMPGIDAVRSRTAHALIEAELRTRGVPHTYHWGQAMPQNPQQVLAGYGEPRVARWLAARKAFLSDSARSRFSNAIVDACGLSPQP